jgi:UDP-glucuronate 4-epimerase
MKILVTGAGGFIGAAAAHRLLERGDTVIGIDNLNDYYDVSLKLARLQELQRQERFTFAKMDIADRAVMNEGLGDVDAILHLAAQAGVRHSITHPHAFVQSNLVGFLNILEIARKASVGHLVFASSSSVYGANTKLPFSEEDNVDHPISLYAATKKSNELMAHSYAHLYRVPCTGLRFFTVYGPWGRPDMSYFLFTKSILEGAPIRVFNNGNMTRDFTYVDDIVEGVVRVLGNPAQPTSKSDSASPGPSASSAPYRIYNIGNHLPVPLMDYIHVLENAIGKKAVIQMLPMQPGDVRETLADVSSLMADTGYVPKVTIDVGVPRFVDWYRRYYKV